GFKEDPIERIVDFQIELRISELPKPMRRIAWWYATHASGYRKAIAMGTFGVSVYGSMGAESLHPLTPLTTALNYSVIHENGDLAVRVIYDHGVMDGATVARTLARLEQVLNHLIAAELRDLASVKPRASDPVPFANGLAPSANDSTSAVRSAR